MTLTAIIDFTSVIFLGVFLTRQLTDRSMPKDTRQLILSLTLITVLITDGLALTFVGPAYPVMFRYVITLISMFVGVALIIIAFTYYVEGLLLRKAQLNPWMFRILKAAEFAWLIAGLILIFSNHMISYPDGVENINNTFPTFIAVTEGLILIGPSVIAVIARKKVGNYTAVLTGLFVFAPAIAFILYAFTDIDLTYASCAVAFLYISLFVQNKQAEEIREAMEQERILQHEGELDSVKRSLNMMFSLSDQFDPIIVLDPETGEYDWMMSKAEEVARNTSMSVHGDNLYQSIGVDTVNIIHEEDRKQFSDFYTKENMMEIARTGVTQETENRWWLKEFGEYRWKYNKAVRTVDEKGKAWVVIGVVDTTETRQKEEQLKEARNAAETANAAKTNFLFSMSHDIRTPMNAIRGFTTIAKKNLDNKEKLSGYLDKIDISSQQLLTLVNQVLEMARIESGRLEFEENRISVHEEYNSMITVLAAQAKSAGLKFHHKLGKIKHNRLLADEARVSSITLNIVGNAMKYTPEGGSISFELKEIESRRPGYATLLFTVSDTGIGMSKEYLEQLYEPFSREKTSTVSRIQGTGLGMSIVKETIDCLNGNIEVQSEQGRGTRFDITLDFKIDENEDEVKEDVALDDATVSFVGRRILLVEDNEMNREIAETILAEQGFIVETAEDGDIAVDMVRRMFERSKDNYYEVILMDVQMPRMNGYEATRAIKAIEKNRNIHIPIVAMTANAFEEDKRDAKRAGMDAHLAKPIDLQKMLRTLAKLLG